jgi:zeaxanthin epoxidase
VQSNALAALEAIDAQLAADVMAAGCVTGDRINGLCDGISGDWYCKFDTYHPAVNNGLPVTRVISRITLQQILAKYAEDIGGPEVIQPNTKVVSFSEDSLQGHDRVCMPSKCNFVLQNELYVPHS